MAFDAVGTLARLLLTDVGQESSAMSGAQRETRRVSEGEAAKESSAISGAQRETRRVSEGEAATDIALAYASGFQ